MGGRLETRIGALGLPSHYLEGEVVHSGDLLELELPDGSWRPVLYDATFQAQAIHASLWTMHLGERAQKTEVREDMHLRWPRTRAGPSTIGNGTDARTTERLERITMLLGPILQTALDSFVPHSLTRQAADRVFARLVDRLVSRSLFNPSDSAEALWDGVAREVVRRQLVEEAVLAPSHAADLEATVARRIKEAAPETPPRGSDKPTVQR